MMVRMNEEASSNRGDGLAHLNVRLKSHPTVLFIPKHERTNEKPKCPETSLT